MTMTAFVRAVEFFESGDYEAALQQFAALVEQTPDSHERAGFLLDQANCYLELGRFEEADHCLAAGNELVGSDPIGRLGAQLGRACCLIEQDRFQDALKALDDLLKESNEILGRADLRGLRREAKLQRSVVLIHLTRYCDAVPDLEEVCTEQPDGEVYSHLARCYYEIKRHADADRNFALAFQHGVPEESQPAFHYFYGRNYWELGDFAKAKQAFMISAQMESPSASQSHVHEMLAATSRLLAGQADAVTYTALGGD